MLRNNTRRTLMASLLLGAALTAGAQTWPARTVAIVVPFPAGGTTDVLARAVATKLSAAIGQPVISDNRPGADATLGAGPVGDKPEEMAKQIGEETAKFALLVQAGKVTLD